MEKFVFLEHTADVKFQAFGNTLEEMTENSFLALKQAMFGKAKINSSKTKVIKAKGKDMESMIYNFLEEVIYFADAGEFLTSKIKDLKIKGFVMEATLMGDKPEKYSLSNNIKAVTYNEMFVKKQDNKWVCQVVLDA